MKELICIVCPNGCHLKVDEENGYNVTGNKCERGAEYGKAELLHPVRVVTSTVRIEGAACRRLPVKTSAAVDKDRIFDVMALLDGVTVGTHGGCDRAEPLRHRCFRHCLQIYVNREERP